MTWTTASATALCTHKHTNHTAFGWVFGDNEDYVLLVTSSRRQVMHKMRCRGCGKTSPPLPQRLIEGKGLLGGASQVLINDATPYVPCCVDDCGATPTEFHHFAPRNTFLGEADRWPVLPLCLPHHHEWHARMDGYRWHRKAAA